MDMTQLLLAIIGVLIAAFGAIFWNRWTTFEEKLSALSMHRENCIRQFADKNENTDDHRRIWKAVENLTTQGHGHEIRLDALEQRMKEKP